MATHAFPQTAFTGGAEVGRAFFGGQEAEFVFGRGTQILPSLGAEIYGSTAIRMVADDVAEWMELGFTMDHLLNGNGAAGFTDQGHYFRINLQQSLDLVNWNMGKFEPAPVPVVDNGDGTWTYWSRCTQPRIWKHITIDETITSTRYAKTITGLQLFQMNIATGMSYPYAMPADAARLQADLRAAGYPGATVTSVPRALSVKVTNWISEGTQNFSVTLTGSTVTQVRNATNTPISLPGYPYSVPSQIPNLQADLIAAGYPYIGVRAYGDEWTIFIADLSTTFSNRRFIATISPADAQTYQGIFGNGYDPGNLVEGTFSNVRANTGLAPLTEASKQFARLGITPGTRYSEFV